MTEGKEPATQQAIPEKVKQPTPEQFITQWPLYTPFPCDNFYPPQQISFHCDGPSCRKETTWSKSGADSVFMGEDQKSLLWVLYKCALCGLQSLLVMYRESALETRKVRPPVIASGLSRSGPVMPQLSHEVRVVTKVQKIGQFPPLSVNIPKALAKNLGDAAADLYKKALVNRNEGYGLAAVTYIRRVVQDKTDELTEVVSQLAESHSIKAEVVEKIRAAKNERTTYDNKLRIAATVLPASLTPDGANPLSELYKLVSEGVHDLSEEDCVRVADETRSVFEFTFTHLRAETKERQEFSAKVKKWAGTS
jgi:hypothetical protein